MGKIYLSIVTHKHTVIKFDEIEDLYAYVRPKMKESYFKQLKANGYVHTSNQRYSLDVYAIIKTEEQ